MEYRSSALPFHGLLAAARRRSTQTQSYRHSAQTQRTDAGVQTQRTDAGVQTQRTDAVAQSQRTDPLVQTQRTALPHSTKMQRRHTAVRTVPCRKAWRLSTKTTVPGRVKGKIPSTAGDGCSDGYKQHIEQQCKRHNRCKAIIGARQAEHWLLEQTGKQVIHRRSRRYRIG